MMKKVLVFLAIAMSLTWCYASPVTQSRALAVAQTFWQKETGAVETPLFIECGASLGLEDIYVFNLKGGNGFVIVSGNDIASPIIGYSTETAFSTENLPEHVRGWLSHYSEEITVAKQRGITQSAEVWSKWTDLESTAQTPRPKSPGTKVVNQLMMTQWNQSSPYNDQCPVDTGGRAVSGCVATAMAQIMRYWSWPPTGTGSHSYTCTTLAEPRELTVDFSAATYNWDNMPAGGRGIYFWSDEEKAEVAQLVYHCGVAVNMAYTRKESGAGTGYLITSLRDYFRYTSNIRGVSRSNYSDAEWLALMKEELDGLRPINYSGSAETGSGGHAFVVDGYDANDYFHVNFGWGGYCDGWYELSNLVTGSGGIGAGSHDYSYRQGAIIGIESPSGIPAHIEVPTLGLAVYDTFAVSETVAYGDYISGFFNIRNFGEEDFTGHYGVGAYRNDSLISVLREMEGTIHPMYYSYAAIYTMASRPLTPGDYVVKPIKSTDGTNWEIIDMASGCPSQLPLHIYPGEYYGASLVVYDTFSVSETVTYDTYIRGYLRLHNFSDDPYTGHYGVGAYRGDTLISVLRDLSDAISSGGDKYISIGTRAIAPLVPGDYIVKPIMSNDGTNWNPITLTHGNGHTSLPMHIDPSEYYGETLIVHDTFSVDDTVVYGEYIAGYCGLRNVSTTDYTGHYGVAAYRGDTLICVLKNIEGTIHAGYRTYLAINKKAIAPLAPGDYVVKPVMSADGEHWQTITRTYGDCVASMPLHIDSSEFDGVNTYELWVYTTFTLSETTAYGESITGSLRVLNADESPFEGFIGIGAYRNGERVQMLLMRSVTMRNNTFTPFSINARALGELTPGNYTAKVLYGQDGVNWREITQAYEAPSSIDFTITASGEVVIPTVNLCVYSDIEISSPTAIDSLITGECCVLNRSTDAYIGFLGIGAFHDDEFIKMMSCGSYSYNQNYYRCTYPSLKAQDPLTPGIYTAKIMYSLNGFDWTPITDFCYGQGKVSTIFNITDTDFAAQTELALYNDFSVSPTVDYGSTLSGSCTITNMGGAVWRGYTGVAAYRDDTFVTMLAQTQDTVANMTPITIEISQNATAPLNPGTYTAKAVYSTDGTNWTVIGESADDCPIAANFTVLKYELQTANPFSITSPTPYGSELTGNCAIANNGTGQFTGYIGVAAYQGSTQIAMLAQEEVVLETTNVQNLYIDYATVGVLTPGDYTAKALYSTDGTNWTAIATAADGSATEASFTISQALPTYGDTNVSACVTYTWPLNDETYDTSGTYNYTITGGNHLGGDSVVTLNLTINSLPPVAIDGPTDIYTGRTAALTATGALSYVWNTGDETEIIRVTPDDTTTYTVTGRDNNGCENTATHTINVTPPPTTYDTIPVTACDSYTWPLNGASYSQSGNFDYTITSGNQLGGDSIITLQLMVNTSPTVTVTGDTIIYIGHTTTLTASGAETYVWTQNGSEVSRENSFTTPAINNDTTYTVVGTASNQCEGSATVTVHTIPIPASHRDTTATVCDSIVWNRTGETYTTSGSYDFTIYGGNSLGGDSIITLQLTVHNSSTELEEHTSCDTYTWPTNHQTYTSSGQYLFDTVNVHNCPKVITLSLTIGNSSSIAIDDSVPAGNVYANHGFYIAADETGAATPGDVLERENQSINTDGCDSTTTLHLTILEPPLIPTIYTDTNATVCDSFTWYGENYTSSCVVTHRLTATNGGDSIITLHLTVNHSGFSHESNTACDSYTWHGETYNQSGDYTFDTITTAGCDSTMALRLTINHTTTGIFTDTACDEYTWHRYTYYESTDTPTYTMPGSNGCDSTVTLHLTINHSSTSDVYDEITVGEAYTGYGFNLPVFDETGHFDFQLSTTNAVDCDSIVTLYLTVSNPGTVEPHTSDTTAVACDSFTWYGTTYTTSSEPTHIFTASDGTDSTVTLHLTIRYSTTSTLSVENCDSYEWFGTTYNTNTAASHVVTNSVGCDSTITLSLTIHHSTSAVVYDSLTTGNAYTGYGFDLPVFDEPGYFDFQLSTTNASGCDSTVTLYLTVSNPGTTEPHTGDTTAVACDSFIWYGTTYTTSSEPTHIFTASDGTDSTVTLHLTIKHSTTSTLSVENCDSYEWFGTTYSTNTAASHVVTNSVGCDSTITLNLTILHSTSAVVYDSITTGNAYTGYGFDLPVLDEPGYFDFQLSTTNAAGCDSTVTLYLTVVESGQSTDSSRLQITSFSVTSITPLGSNITGTCVVARIGSTAEPTGSTIAVGAYRGDTMVCVMGSADAPSTTAGSVTIAINRPATAPLTAGNYIAKALVSNGDGQWIQITDAIEGCPIETEFSVIDNSSINATAGAQLSTVTAYTKGLTLIVKNCSGQRLEVADLIGRTIYSDLPTTDETTIPLPAAGIYFVKPNGQKAIKVIAR